MIHANLTSAFLPIGWGPFQDVNLFYFLLKMQIWNGCNVLNIVENPIKDINVNLSFLSSRWKVVEWTFPGLGHFLNVFLSSGWKVVDWTFPGLENFLNAFLSSGSKVVGWTPQIWHLMEILEILLVYVQYNDTCKFAITLFPISWGPFQDVNFTYSLLKMQIWNGCNVLNIVGNPIKDININLSFLSSGWKVVEWTFPGLENFLYAQDWKIFWMHFWVQDISC